jgi:drug/metabolite transporter (DMT)-like permease
VSLSRAARERGLFLLLCVIWGSTWLALKIGATTVPPGLFSGTRWIVAGGTLLLWLGLRGERVRVRADLLPRLIAVGLLMISLNAVLMMYGLRLVLPQTAPSLLPRTAAFGIAAFGLRMTGFGAKLSSGVRPGWAVASLTGFGRMRGETSH